nr:hypothetical protein [Tanacetum cinerariifolium]
MQNSVCYSSIKLEARSCNVPVCDKLIEGIQQPIDHAIPSVWMGNQDQLNDIYEARDIKHSTVTEVRAAMEAADNEFTRWEVQEHEVDGNALSIPKSNKSLFKVITILAEGMFGFYAAMNGLADFEKKKCNLSVIVTALVIVFGGIALGLWLQMGSSESVRDHLSAMSFHI